MKLENALKHIVTGISNSYGTNFFTLITQELARAVDADFCFIARINETFTISRTIATFAHGETVKNFEYALKGTPCEQVTCNRTSVYPKEVIPLFPTDDLLQQMQVEAYVGASLKDMKGDVIGLVVALFHNEIHNTEDIYTLFKLFTGRIEAEIDRVDKEFALKELSQSLEEKVKISTKRLVEQEKFASLGQLVAGVSHEINTPLGIGVTATSILKKKLNDFSSDIKNETLTQNGLDTYLLELQETTNILELNLSRAANLIQNFKQVAVGQSNLLLSKFNLKDTIVSIVESLRPAIKKLPIEVVCEIDEHILVTSYQADYFQVFNNLIMNALMHAFENKKRGLLKLTATIQGDILTFSIKDDGIGIKKENLTNIFDPFFTTKRGAGGTGLGLNIVYNTVVHKLLGKIKVLSVEDEGTEFVLELPIKLEEQS